MENNELEINIRNIPGIDGAVSVDAVVCCPLAEKLRRADEEIYKAFEAYDAQKAADAIIAVQKEEKVETLKTGIRYKAAGAAAAVVALLLLFLFYKQRLLGPFILVFLLSELCAELILFNGLFLSIAKNVLGVDTEKCLRPISDSLNLEARKAVDALLSVFRKKKEKTEELPELPSAPSVLMTETEVCAVTPPDMAAIGIIPPAYRYPAAVDFFTEYAQRGDISDIAACVSAYEEYLEKNYLKNSPEIKAQIYKSSRIFSEDGIKF